MDSKAEVQKTGTGAQKKIDLNDHYAIKRILDDTVSEVILARGYAEHLTLSNIKMGIGILTCAVAFLAQFYPKKLPESKPFLYGCITLYLMLNSLLQFIIYTKEKNRIMFTYPLQGSFTSTGLAISSKLPRYSDLYTLEIASSDAQSIAAHSPVELTKSVTKWFTKEGVLAEGIFWDDVQKLLDDFQSEPRKSK
ncbi:hypothetical protein O6H91_03G061000 [Diphasiastrum complanatum]|uniref:Uncharacterized protein n=1 Tax=Diphasiastrum complanatum TaxID=34168 RepID=A0ACC2E6Y5_DIPCM|nr:hypothetical protein O6H91_03G061000 [Diphasiastrum complanatum]